MEDEEMEAAEKVKVLQAAYAGALADTVLRLGREGVLGKVTGEKKEELKLTGSLRAKQLGAARPEEVIPRTAEIFGCADWSVSEKVDGSGFTAAAPRCMLCAMARKLGTQSPCSLYCLDPMEGMIRGIAPSAEFTVESTLWDGPECRIDVTCKK
jgi:hypothetical protein